MSRSLEEAKQIVLRVTAKREHGVPQRDEAISIADSVSQHTNSIVAVRNSSDQPQVAKQALARHAAAALYDVMRVAVAANVVVNASDSNGVPTVPLRLFEARQKSHPLPPTASSPAAAVPKIFSDISNRSRSNSAGAGAGQFIHLGRKKSSGKGFSRRSSNANMIPPQHILQRRASIASSVAAAAGAAAAVVSSSGGDSSTTESSDFDDDDDDDDVFGSAFGFGGCAAGNMRDAAYVNSIPASGAASPFDTALQHSPLISMGSGIVPVAADSQQQQITAGGGGGSSSHNLRAMFPRHRHVRTSSGLQRAQEFEQLWFSAEPAQATTVVEQRLVSFLGSCTEIGAAEDLLEDVNAEIGFVTSLAEGIKGGSCPHVQYAAALDSFERADRALTKAQKRLKRSRPQHEKNGN